MYKDKLTGTEIYKDIDTGKYYVPNECSDLGYKEIQIPDTQIEMIPLNWQAQNSDLLLPLVGQEFVLVFLDCV
jgi:hypothetical protein